MTVTELKVNKFIPDSTDLLTEAIDEEFDSVIIFGFRDNKIYVQSSSYVNKLELIGALEAAKIDLWTGSI